MSCLISFDTGSKQFGKLRRASTCSCLPSCISIPKYWLSKNGIGSSDLPRYRSLSFDAILTGAQPQWESTWGKLWPRTGLAVPPKTVVSLNGFSSTIEGQCAALKNNIVLYLPLQGHVALESRGIESLIFCFTRDSFLSKLRGIEASHIGMLKIMYIQKWANTCSSSSKWHFRWLHSSELRLRVWAWELRSLLEWKWNKLKIAHLSYPA